MKTKLRILAGITLLFFLSMAALTFTARGVHASRLPRVTARRLTRESFSVILDGRLVQYRQTAIPKELLNAGDIFVLAPRAVNGETRDFARKVRIETGLEIEGFYEVVRGISGHELVIFHSDRPITDGEEVRMAEG
ncbi:MAG: hypothetical protein FWG93_06850 [Oscillospiraceae bacterium]|nr:hypothetical protein [Oscillospiraceae bacterium]